MGIYGQRWTPGGIRLQRDPESPMHVVGVPKGNFTPPQSCNQSRARRQAVNSPDPRNEVELLLRPGRRVGEESAAVRITRADTTDPQAGRREVVEHPHMLGEANAEQRAKIG